MKQEQEKSFPISQKANKPEDHPDADNTHVLVTYVDVVERVHRLSQTVNILGAFLLHKKHVVVGHCADSRLDLNVTGRALCRLVQVFASVNDQFTEEKARELQTTVGEHRLIISSLGDLDSGFQVGLVVRSSTPVCKSLPRLLRQIDRAFIKTHAKQLERAFEEPLLQPSPALPSPEQT